LELDRPLDTVLVELAGVAWDSEEELVTLQPAHVIEVLSRFQSARLSAEDVERWANAIEGRDDIGCEDESRALLKETMFDLANPDLQGALTTEVAARWVERLRAVRTESTPGAGG
jgi:hypothetical protein